MEAADLHRADGLQESLRGAIRRMLGSYRLLRGNRDFHLLFAAQITSVPADWLYTVALLALAYNLTHSATIVGLLTLARLLPYALFLLFLGFLADRSNRKALMIGTSIGRGIGVLALVAVHPQATLLLAFVVVFVTSALSGLFRPALNSALPSVVRPGDLVEANSLMSQVDMASYGVGPALGALFVLVGHPQLAFLLTSALFLVSGGTLAFASIPDRTAQAPADARVWHETVAGFLFLRSQHRGVPAAYTVTVAGVSLLGGAYWTIAGVLATHELHLGSQGMGLLCAAYGVGGLAAGLLIGSTVSGRDLAPFFIAGILSSCLAAALFGLSPAGPLPFLSNAVMGGADVFVSVSAVTVIQAATPARLLGRVFGAYEAALILAMVLGSLVVGPAVDVLGPRITTLLFALAGIASLGGCIPWLLQLEPVLGVQLFLRRVPALSVLAYEELDVVRGRLQLERFPAGAVIIREGERGDHFYIVKEGVVEVSQGTDPGVERLGRHGKTDYFGEIALLRDLPRAATVKALSPVELYRLNRADFESLLGRSEEFHRAIEGAMDVRYLNARTRLLLRR